MMNLDTFIGKQVVLDTAQTVVYVGTLEQITTEGFWLSEADVHDTREGHMSKELYVIEAKRQGICANRKRVFVMRSVVTSISALDDVMEE